MPTDPDADLNRIDADMRAFARAMADLYEAPPGLSRKAQLEQAWSEAGRAYDAICRLLELPAVPTGYRRLRSS